MRVAEYVAPQNLDDAVKQLANRGARALAGGNSLLVEPSRSQLANASLVDLRRVPGLAGIQAQDGVVRIGAMTTLAAIAADASLQQKYPALAEAAAAIGDVQVRNRGTIGGNLAETDPEVDLPAVVLALGAQIQVQGPNGSRAVAANELFTGSGQRALQPGDLITAVILPAVAPRTGSAYEKFKHPATLYAICGVAASVTLGGNGTISSCAIAVTGATEAPTRLSAVESALQGKAPDAAALSAAAGQLGAQLRFRGDHFASAEYRQHLTSVLTQRAVSRAAERAGR